MSTEQGQYEELEYLDIVAGGKSQILLRENKVGFPSYSESSHHYKVLSDPIPGATLAEANDLVNRYNAPTRAGLWGEGNDPRADHGWVAEPHTGLPIGSVSMDRGVGDDGHAWARNTTDALHPFHGTITRTVVDSPEGFRIMTEGEGHGAGPIPILGNTRHYLNAQHGPEIFQQLDQNMLDHWKGGTAHDQATGARTPEAPVQPPHGGGDAAVPE